MHFASVHLSSLPFASTGDGRASTADQGKVRGHVRYFGHDLQDTLCSLIEEACKLLPAHNLNHRGTVRIKHAMQPLNMSETVLVPEACLESSQAGWNMHEIIVKETNAPESRQRKLGVRVLRYNG
jgi:hypothetical protein